jgi:hypothetical protein
MKLLNLTFPLGLVAISIAARDSEKGKPSHSRQVVAPGVYTEGASFGDVMAMVKQTFSPVLYGGLAPTSKSQPATAPAKLFQQKAISITPFKAGSLISMVTDAATSSRSHTTANFTSTSIYSPNNHR